MKILHLLGKNDSRYQGHLKFFLFSYFLVLFNYPMVRASSTTMFFEEFGAKSSPLAWLITVGALSLAIVIFNTFQARHSVQKVMFWVSMVSTLIFGLSVLGFTSQVRYASYLSFIWKEICIVLQIHLLLAYANNYFRKEDFKSIIGPVGAVGSIGGIFGGIVTTYLSKTYGTNFVAWFSLLFVLLPGFLFLKTPILRGEGQETKASPIRTINVKGVRQYVFHIGLVVMLTQFVINIADFKFNLAFEQSITSSRERTAYLGLIYSWTNTISLLLQFVLLPFLLPRVSERSIHLFIPISYMVLLVGVLITGSISPLLPVAIFYTYLKASDYSLFSAGKELLYQVLAPEQKYGAKYLTDMLIYRFAKALIAAVLIYLQTSFMLNMLMITFLLLWLILIVRTFTIQRRLFN